jgi:peptidoglycan/LPS O-acetylase OafA/YrhL
MPQRYIVSHTSIRGIAALLVVAYHLQFGALTPFAWERATPFFDKGYLWVDLFFVLSGFVISYSARMDERAPFSASDIKTFYVSRFARIYPLHAVALILMLGLFTGESLLARFAGIGHADPNFGSARNIAGFFEQLFLLNAWGLTGPPGWNIPSWSISAEAIAYLVFPLAAAAIARWRGVSLAAIALGAALFYLWIGTTTGILDIVQREAILRCLAGFGLGVILYAIRSRIDRLSDWTLTALQLAGAAIVLVTMVGGFNDTLVIPGFVLLVGATWPDRGLLARPLQTGPMHWLGEISYSVYLNHLWVLGGWRFVTERVLMVLGAGPHMTRAVILAGGVASVLIVSHFTYRYIEGPARLAIVRRYAAHRARRDDRGLPAGNEVT